ncbi:putative PurR-regulated permease PerM [Devosia sp. UYZn731]|uniref:AI-2E family transporter n=1 Tax=Devosia sp. UYZn731 TaxID=3156345 RepID=UPI00339282F7
MADPLERTTSLPVFVRATDRGNPLVTASIIMVAVVILYLGAGILVPLVLAVLLAFALAPLIRRLRRLHIPHILAVLLAVALAAAVLSTIAYVVASQLIKLASDLPSYQSTVTAKTQALQHSLGGGAFVESLTGALDRLSGQFAGAVTAGTAPPMPVTITNGGAGPLGIVQSVLGSVLGPLATAAIVLVFLIFLLLEREDLRDRFLKLVSRGDLRTSTKVMNEAAARVSRYLLVQFCVNLSYGTIFGMGLSIIGVPNAILWGLLAAMFRYIPFVGTIIAASIPFTLAFAVDPGWSMLLSSVALYVALELVITNAIEPRLYGSSTGLSAIAVLIAAMFWATMWGPIGLILSTPITVCLVVLGRYVPQLAFFETLLGSEPVLSPPERFYQRLVAGNVEEAIGLADEFIAVHDAPGFYEAIAMPALRLAETDLSLDVVDLSHRRNVVDSMMAVINDIDIDQDPEAASLPPRVFCIGGRTELDEAAAQILSRLLLAAGHPAKALAPLTIRQESIGQLALAGIEVVCLCYVGDNPRSYARFVAKRLLRQHPELAVIACVLGDGPTANPEHADWGTKGVVYTLKDAVASIRKSLEPGVLPSGNTALEEPIDEASLVRLRRLAQSDGPLSDMLGEIAKASGMPVAIMEIADAVSPTAVVPAGSDPRRVSAPSQQVFETNKAVIVPNVAVDPLFGNDPYLLENGVRFFAGVPLLGPDGEAIGSLALLDHEPREFTDADRERLELQALRLMVKLGRSDKVPDTASLA